MPNTVLGSGNSVVDQAPDLMDFTFWWGDNEQNNVIFGSLSAVEWGAP